LKDKSLSVLIKELDDVFSKYIRRKDSVNGKVKCFICGVWIPMSTADNMHYIDRDQMTTRYDEMNCHEGCQQCNRFDPYHKERYCKKMIFTYGFDAVIALEQKSRSLAKFTRYDLLELIQEYKTKLKLKSC
jgi:hypothetical protein